MLYTYHKEETGIVHKEIKKFERILKVRGVYFSKSGIASAKKVVVDKYNRNMEFLKLSGYDEDYLTNRTYNLGFIQRIIGGRDLEKYFKGSWKVKSEFSLESENFDDYLKNYGGTESGKIVGALNEVTKENRNITMLNSYNSFRKASVDGWVIPQLKHLVTGRLSTSKPCLESMNTSFKDEVLSLKELGDYDIVEIDFKEEEPRIAISSQGVSKLIDKVKVDPENISVYQTIADEVYCLKEFKDIEEKALFKRAWNAVTYGMTEGSLNTLFKNTEYKGSLIYKYFMSDENYLNWLDSLDITRNKILCLGELYTVTPLGTKIKLGKQDYNALINNGTRSAKADKLDRLLRSYPMQGCGVDILELALRAIEEVRAKHGVVDTDVIDDRISSYITEHDAIYVIVDRAAFTKDEYDEILNDLKLTIQIIVDGVEWIPLCTKLRTF